MADNTINALVQHAANAREVIPTILRTIPQIKSVSLLRMEIPTAKSHNREDRSAVTRISEPALRLRGDYGIPFWTALMITAAHTGEVIPGAVLRTAAFHQVTSATSKSAALDAHSLSAEVIEKYALALSDREVLALSSRVTLKDGSEAHLPMLDFRLRPGESNLITAKLVVEQLEMPGVILNSGNSYHFYGLNLLTSEALGIFLARALLLAPLVDHRWIAHQLLEKSCALRVSRGVHAQREPFVVASVTTGDN